ncbi:hypothetical protein K1719_023645 [Acacia pycnantha]|nr:hypothetical protein K1719_023645 [Acacia pycnantha]
MSLVSTHEIKMAPAGLTAGIACCVSQAQMATSPVTTLVSGTMNDDASSCKKLVLTLYDALNSGDSDTVVGIVAPDLEWWFHGPPSHQFLMRLLTGQPSSFRFLPKSIASFGPTVVVEGCDHSRSISWVHAWTVADGIITQVREYLDTSLTVTRFGHPNSLWESTVSNLLGKSVPGLVLAL